MNALGYYGIFFGLQYRNSTRMVKAFDEGTYDTKSEIVFELPVAIPYNGNTPYQRVDGTFQYHGEFYRLIKQRFHNDTLQVVLMKDDRHKEMQEKIVRHTERNNSEGTTIDFIKDYLPEKIDIATQSEGWQQKSIHCTTIDFRFGTFPTLDSPPPKEV